MENDGWEKKAHFISFIYLCIRDTILLLLVFSILVNSLMRQRRRRETQCGGIRVAGRRVQDR